MAIHRLREMTWTEVASLDTRNVVALVAVGAIEAHGPHLPLDTDVVIASSMVDAAADELDTQDLDVLILPQITYTAADFAANFSGTISIDPKILTALISDIAQTLSRWRIPVLGIANAHLDPVHLGSLHAAVEAIQQEGRVRVAFPDLTRRPWGSLLTDEFKSGACHAGQFETSIVLAAAEKSVRNQRRQELAPNPISLSQAIAEGISSFEAAGGADAYFGDPAAATREEGERTIQILGQILAEAIVNELDQTHHE
ncbi:MAG: creatininase family protein [Acidobacteriota bacterium]